MRLIALALFCGLAMAQKPLPVIFDTDIGDDIDDALALALILQSPELKTAARNLAHRLLEASNSE